MRNIDIDFIRKWVDISEEELMMRLVKDAISLQNEAKENARQAEIKARREDPEYNIDFVKDFFCSYGFFKDYFSDEQILRACQNHMTKRDMAKEAAYRGRLTKTVYGRILRYENNVRFKEYKGSWEREVTDYGTIVLEPDQYQINADKVANELLHQAFPWLHDYSVSIYKIDSYDKNPLIFIKTPDELNTGYSTSSLYVPVKAMFAHDADAVINSHTQYWHDYGHSKYDEATKVFMATDHVAEILKHIREE